MPDLNVLPAVQIATPLIRMENPFNGLSVADMTIRVNDELTLADRAHSTEEIVETAFKYAKEDKRFQALLINDQCTFLMQVINGAVHPRDEEGTEAQEELKQTILETLQPSCGIGCIVL